LRSDCCEGLPRRKGFQKPRAVHSLSEAAYERAFDTFVRSIAEDLADFHQISYYETEEK
jgi:hypothetical protein